MNGLTGIVDAAVQPIEEPNRLRESEVLAQAYRERLRDAVCIEALLGASEMRAVGDDAEMLLGEAIGVLTGNLWHAFAESAADAYPPGFDQAAGQLNALALARNAIMKQAINAVDSEHSYLTDQVGWLDTLAMATTSRLIGILREAS